MEPAVLTSCHGADGIIGTGPLNPAKETTFEFLTTLFAEVASLFEEKMFMVGGDEVNFGCWQSNPEVVAFAESKGWGNSTAGMKQLESYCALIYAMLCYSTCQPARLPMCFGVTCLRLLCSAAAAAAACAMWWCPRQMHNGYSRSWPSRIQA